MCENVGVEERRWRRRGNLGSERDRRARMLIRVFCVVRGLSEKGKGGIGAVLGGMFSGVGEA